jgi:heptosyltransferase-2
VASTLVIQTSFLGDTVLTTPLLAQLARRGPVDIVTTPASATLLANHPAVRRVIPYDKRGADRGLGGLISLAQQLREAKYDVALLAQGSWRSAALALIAGIPSRLGFNTSAGRWFYTKRVAYREDLHHAARLLMLARPNGREPSIEELRPSLYPGAEDRAAVDAVLAANGVADGETLIALAPGSVWGTKRWPYYLELAQLLADATTRIVIVGGNDDRELASAIVSAVPSTVNTTGMLSLLASADLIGRSAALVTNDSLPEHLASAMATPTIAIFGPTVPEFGFGPLAPRATVVGHTGLACRPCDRHGPQRCPLGHHKCMRELEAFGVAEQVRSLLSLGNVDA